MAAKIIEREEIQHLIHEGAQLLDALPPEEYKNQHLPGAINVPLEKFTLDMVRDLDRNKPTITYCADNQCDLSARLAARLVLEGFADVREYAKSLADWSAYGLPLEGEDATNAAAKDLARSDFSTCSPDDAASGVSSRIGEGICLVVDEDGALVGRLKADQLKDGAKVREVMDAGPSTFRPDVPIADMADWFKKRPKFDAFIITTPDGHPFGVLHREDVEHAMKHAATEKATASAR